MTDLTLTADTELRVREIVAHVLKVDLTRVKPDSRFVEDLGANSIESIELVAAFEDAFDIEMDEQKALSVKDVRNAVAFIRGYL